MLNWLVRYAPVTDLLLDGEGRLAESVLDVGSGSQGFACTGSDQPFVGLDLLFPQPVAATMLAVKGRPGRFPFADASFDTVVSLDTLEHVPPLERGPFAAELGRVAARRVLLACPCDEGAAHDEIVRQAFVRAGGPLPDWLDEHDEHGLPTAAEIEEACRAVAGFRCRPYPMVNGLLSLLAVVGDMYPELAASAAREFAANRSDWLELFRHGSFGQAPRKAFLLERIEPRVAAVDRRRLPETALAALRCLDCGAAFAPVDGVLVCTGCGGAVGRDGHGAWDLSAPDLPPRRPEPPPGPAFAPTPGQPPAPAATAVAPVSTQLKTSASLRLWLEPDWKRVEEWLPALSTYVAHADLDGDTCLCLAVDGSGLPLETVVGLIATACDHVSGYEPFARVLIVDEPMTPEAAGAVPVATAADVRALVGLTESVPADDAGIVAHARRSKQLADELRGIVDRVLYETAPPPSAEDEPLVTIRIATWGSHDLLLSRAIPSVLGGTYPNVEILVVSDGPGPDARRAVEALGDPRVRFLELPERPSYPMQDWNFWQSAGAHAVNLALDVARGEFVAPLDHDDSFTADHVRTLLATLRERNADMVYGQALCERRNGPWSFCGSQPLAEGDITHGSVLYSRRLAHFRLDPESWLINQPGDWDMWRRMRDAGARIEFLERVVFLHFRERSSIEDDPSVDPVERIHRGDAENAADVLATPARWLLDVGWRHA